MLVLDDGWFGKRNADNCSLGDWYVDSKKLPGGLRGVANAINSLGMKFGLWFEPEMVSLIVICIGPTPIGVFMYLKDTAQREDRN